MAEIQIGGVSLASESSGTVTLDSGVEINEASIKTGINATGSAPIYACRAWVNFNGTGTVAIRASGNVSSITDNGVGIYTVNFTTSMPDANYVATGACGRSSNGYEFFAIEGTSNMTTSSVRIATRAVDQAGNDEDTVSVAIFR